MKTVLSKLRFHQPRNSFPNSTGKAAVHTRVHGPRARAGHAWIGLLALMILGFTANDVCAQGIQWLTTVAEAKQKAATENKLVLLHFTADWSRSGQMIEKFVYRTPAVQRVMQTNVIAVHIDADKELELVNQYGVDAVPFDVVLTPGGRIVSKRKSPTDALTYEKMIRDLDRVLNALAEEHPSASQDSAEVANLIAKKVSQETHNPNGYANSKPAEIGRTVDFTPGGPSLALPTPSTQSFELHRKSATVQNGFAAKPAPVTVSNAFAGTGNAGTGNSSSKQPGNNTTAGTIEFESAAAVEPVTVANATLSSRSSDKGTNDTGDQSQVSGAQYVAPLQQESPVAWQTPNFGAAGFQPRGVGGIPNQQGSDDDEIELVDPKSIAPNNGAIQRQAPAASSGPASVETSPQTGFSAPGELGANSPVTNAGQAFAPSQFAPSQFAPSQPTTSQAFNSGGMQVCPPVNCPPPAHSRFCRCGRRARGFANCNCGNLNSQNIEYTTGELATSVPANHAVPGSTNRQSQTFAYPEQPEMQLGGQPQASNQFGDQATTYPQAQPPLNYGSALAAPAPPTPPKPPASSGLSGFQPLGNTNQVQLNAPAKNSAGDLSPIEPASTADAGRQAQPQSPFGEAKPVPPRNIALQRLEQSEVAARLIQEKAQRKMDAFQAEAKVVMDEKFFGPSSSTTSSDQEGYEAKINLPSTSGSQNASQQPSNSPNGSPNGSTNGSTSQPMRNGVSATKMSSGGAGAIVLPKHSSHARNDAGNNASTMSTAEAAVIAGLSKAATQPTTPQFALHGKCPVTLLKESRWVDGDPQFGCVHRNRIYIFTSAENLARFKTDPDAYSPVLAGYDPVIFQEMGRLVDGLEEYGVFMGTAPDQRIVLFANPETRARFQLEPRKYLDSVRQAMRSSGGASSDLLR